MDHGADPEAVLIEHTIERDETTGSLVRRQLVSARWHLFDALRALTFCGMDVGYGSPRRSWSATPADRQCQICVSRVGLADA